jgi:selenocysteine lyase/cysteine desulfurase
MGVALETQRHLFEIPEEISYLNCAYMSPQLRAVREAGEKAVARKSHPWEISPRDFFENSETARELFARLVGGDMDGVAIIPSVSYGMAVATANVPVKRGHNVVVLAEQFPSNVYPWRELAKRKEAAVVTVPRPRDHDWTTAALACVDEETAVVAVPNCHWTDGSLLDLARVGERAREVGAALVIDAIQSLGAHPFDVREVQPDFLVASSYKWLLGPYGLGFL